MPNYRYNTPDYMRRNSYSRQTSGSPQTSPSSSCSSVSPACSYGISADDKVCCESRANYDPLQGMPIAMAYVPWQRWCNLYEPEKGFHQGTIFEELDKPFRGIGGCCR